jgi:hypothetical protein
MTKGKLNLYTTWLPSLPGLLKKLENATPEVVARDVGAPNLRLSEVRDVLDGPEGDRLIKQMAKEADLPEEQIREQLEFGYNSSLKAVSELAQAESILEDLKAAVVFDCRNIPLDFIEDSGDAYWHELQETKQLANLPFDESYFEFPDGNAALGLCIHGEGSHHIEIYYFDEERPAIESIRCSFRFGKRVGRDLFRTVIEGNQTDETKKTGQRYGLRVAGVLKLLKERLLVDRIEPDPDPVGSMKREKRNQLPWTGETHVLSVNVPAVRQATTTPIGTHESPRLHWRRGHHRTLYRGSEREFETWVRPCLVGDPDKGFVRSSYRLTSDRAVIAN